MDRIDHGKVEWTRQSGCHTARAMGVRVGQIRYNTVSHSYDARKIGTTCGWVKKFETLKAAKDWVVS